MLNNRCFNCANYFGDLTCQAFPDQIPDEILVNKNDHTKPLPDQGNEIVYEPIEATNDNK